VAKVIIFGTRDMASLAHFYLRHDSDHQVVAFSVAQSYMPDEATFEGLPVVPFEEVEDHYNPEDHLFFAPMTHRKMNRLRAEIYENLKKRGYSMISYVSPRATIYPGTPIGENCFILENNTIQPYTKIGNNVFMGAGNVIGHHSVIKDHVFFAANVVVSGNCTIESHCFFGVNSSTREGLHIAEGTMVAMAAAIAKNTEAWRAYYGVFARKGLVASDEQAF